MLCHIKRFSSVYLIFAVLTSCSKKHGLEIPPNDIIETSITQRPVTTTINSFIGGFYEAVPAHYKETTKNYPLIIFLHGGGQMGDGKKDLPQVLNDGIAKEISTKKLPANFNVNGDNFSFIVLSPQFNNVPPDSIAFSFVDYALKHYRVDSSRIYLCGLSMGGILTTALGGQHHSLFAAILPISGESAGANRADDAKHIADGALPMWLFHNSGDPMIPVSLATDFFNMVTENNPISKPRLTIFQAYGHDAWTQALDPSYKENNRNVYEWLLSHKR